MDYYYDDEIFYTKAATNWLALSLSCETRRSLSLFQTARSCVILQDVRDNNDYAEKLKICLRCTL